MGIENATDIIIHTNFNDISFVVNIISASVVFVLIWQVAVLRRQNALAYNPLMSLRFYRDNNRESFILIENVGHGTALNVELKISDHETNEELITYKSFAVKKDESWRTPISFKKHPRVDVSGTYYNVKKDLLIIRDRLFDYEFLGRED